jgi:cobalt/nickel transport system permease protein
MAVSTIVLGPWGSILSISVALLIQALFFGDGGITAFGANCFNMAIVGSLVAYVVYRLIAGRAAISSPRRVAAAAIAGYVAINVSALCAAIEFGIQPALFHDASGAPLYAPYPLSVAIPAMLLGHLTIAGLAELVVSGGVLAYLQRSEPALLKLTAPGAAEEGMAEVTQRGGWRAARPLLILLAVMMILSPLGLVATGTAWGEWAPQDFVSAQARHEIQVGSGNAAPPAAVPPGMERLSGVWSAVLPDYDPFRTQNVSLQRIGYVISAVVGGGLILLAFLLISWVAQLVGGGRKPVADGR